MNQKTKIKRVIGLLLWGILFTIIPSFHPVAAEAADTYGLTIAGVQVTSQNRSDVLENGVFSFDGNRTLTIKGDYTGNGNDDLIKSEIKNLIIKIEGDSILNGRGKNCLCLYQDTTIVGKGWQELLILYSSGSAGIYIEGGHTIILDDIMMNITGKWGITGSQTGEKLIAKNSYVETYCQKGAVGDLNGGISFDGCDMMNMGVIKDGSILNSTGNYEKNVIISISYQGTWKQDEKGWWYQNPDGSYPKNQLKKIDGKWYYFDERGYMQTGWKLIEDKWYYFDDNGYMQTGWKEINEKWYYFDISGQMQTGWKKIEDKWYYFNDGGYMQTGWKKIEEKWYYFETSGVMQTDLKQIEGKWYYFKPSGEMYTGWKQTGDKWNYFNEGGSRQTGWKQIQNRWYYFNELGEMQTGWKKIGNKWYYLDESGRMQTGWKQIEEKWYYFDEEGCMQTGWIQIGDKKYYLNDSGCMQTGWKKIGDKWYYFKNSGEMQTGWLKVEDTYYYLKEDGSMAAGEWVENGKYYIDNKGHWVKNPT